MYITRNTHILCIQKSRRNPEAKTDYIFYLHNHFTTMTKLLAIDVVKNIIHDK